MNHLTVGQRAPLSNLAIDDTVPITLKFTRQSPIEMDVSCFALDAEGKLINDDYMVFYNQPTSPCGQIKLTHYESQPTASKGIQAEFEVNLSKLTTNIDSLFFCIISRHAAESNSIARDWHLAAIAKGTGRVSRSRLCPAASQYVDAALS